MYINGQNFLRWDDGTGQNPQDLPQAYIKNRCPEFMPIFVPGERLSFYINTKFGVNFGGGLRIQYQRNGSIVATSNVIQYDLLDISHYNIFADYVLPSLPNGVYKLLITNTAGTTTYLTSNKVYVMNEDYENISSYLEFTNGDILYNVRYNELNNFYQRFRLMITDVTGGDYEMNNESYLATTTGRYRDLLANPQRYYTFEMYYADKDALEAITAFLAHRTRIINEKEYAFKEGMIHNPITTVKTVKATFQMYDQSFATINKCDNLIASS